MDKSTFYYELPNELIAQEPLKKRSSSRLLVLHKQTGAIEHHTFSDITRWLNPGDCLVLNDTKVMPARLMGVKETGAVIEVLLLKRHADGLWEALVKPGRRMKVGDTVLFGEGILKAQVREIGEGGVRILAMEYEGIFEEILDALGEMPLPHYITKKLEDKSQYQTVYAEKLGSAAAPTAGLHFTPELLEEIEAAGIAIAKVTLHVGLGTFRPIKVRNILDHKMHSEHYVIDRANADKINAAKAGGGKVICVGTTAVRTLESAADADGRLAAAEGDTEIFIYPGYRFKIVDELITNFHLPESTLMALVSALAGTPEVLAAYQEAVRLRYRFFSFGDAMLIRD